MMIDNLEFYIVDVFAEEKYSGNQLAVVRGGGDLSKEYMQMIAKEMGYSETTFILSDEEQDGGYPVRIFTPEEEVPFAGHPTLGTAYIIQREIIRKDVDAVVLNLDVGQIPVMFREGYLEMKQMAPTFGEIVPDEKVAKALNVDLSSLDDNYPSQVVSTGIPFLMVPMKSLSDVINCPVRAGGYQEFLDGPGGKGILVFTRDSVNSENDLHVRVFAGGYGVAEDPATGSANGCLAGYLVKHSYLGDDKIDIRVEQGFEIGRPSILFLNASSDGDSIQVNVGGQVFMVARGNLV